MTTIRDQIAAALRADQPHLPWPGMDQMTAAIMTAVEPALAAKDAEIERLAGDLHEMQLIASTTTTDTERAEQVRDCALQDVARLEAQKAQLGKQLALAQAAIQRVRDMHAPDIDGVCDHCWCGHPCATLITLDQPESETP